MVAGAFFSLAPYRFSGGIILILAENRPCAAESTGRFCTFVLAGSFPKKFSPFQFNEGQPVEEQTRRRNLDRYFP
jgi:hypothetical protein